MQPSESEEDHPTKRRRLTQKSNTMQIQLIADPSWENVMKDVNVEACRVGKVQQLRYVPNRRCIILYFAEAWAEWLAQTCACSRETRRRESSCGFVGDSKK